MARFEHTVTVDALDRGWFEETAGHVVDLFEASREQDGAILLPDGRPVHGLRLLKGRHLQPGAEYGEAPGKTPGEKETAAESAAPPEKAPSEPAVESAVLREWRPSRVIEVESHAVDEGMSMRVGVRLREPRAPKSLELSLDGHNPEGGSLYRFSGRAKADLHAWWAALEQPLTAPPPARAPVVGKAVHRLGKARLTVTPRAAGDGSWRVSVVLSLRGRWLLRPVAAVGLFFARKPVERGFREAVDSSVAEWAEMLAELPRLRGEALRAEIADALTEPPEPVAEEPEPSEPAPKSL
ncbi:MULTISPECIES: hypothetical protein [Streptomyces]|uniref:hypothetical protein n=1 Tax=Streptomyces TaxID=1883 RepID=UPI001040970C|nr:MULTISPECIES: hypothetical protein [Streptomyces]MBT3076054.1 hypothetical protein [Streptomyces sp. COG21]MBT3079434.1 hypothetical protein [Streptomyces sp. COG20]MBT3085670.1 hypothetical protein [Streptomyces sp. CYG21]MBT3096032.1 hypothetical protein [Streptomyces sp. CBG30]MBT3106700.1 hypothetical protein [Streptomyces sp. COG19]